jgi:hypothetical protein
MTLPVTSRIAEKPAFVSEHRFSDAAGASK